MAWGDSGGSTSESRRAREECLNRARRQCQLRYDGCTGHATHADHKVNIASLGLQRGEATDPADLQAACEWCHGIKSKAEAREGTVRHNKARAARRRQPVRPHPGD